jgi:hypothetical protein
MDIMDIVVINGEVLEVNLTGGYLKIREESGENHVIKALVSKLMRIAPGDRIRVEVRDGYAVSIKPLIKEAGDSGGHLRRKKTGV